MSNKKRSEGKFNGRYMDYCDEFDPKEASIAGSKSSNWDSFEVPDNEAEHRARPGENADSNAVLARIKKMKLGRGILRAAA